MKRFPFLPMVVAVVLAVTAFSCTPLQEADREEYYERVSSAPARIYVDDPYRGTVILERDPYTGRYYDVSAYGYRNSYGYGYDRFGRYNDRNYYPRTGRRVYRSPQQNTTPPPSPEQRQKNKEEARNKVLGGN